MDMEWKTTSSIKELTKIMVNMNITIEKLITCVELIKERIEKIEHKQEEEVKNGNQGQHETK